MPATVPASHPWLHAALAAGLLVPLSGAAQLPSGGRTAAGSLSMSITVKPQFRILESRPVRGGHEYRVWTNMKSVRLNGQEYRFQRIGEATVTVPGALVDMPDGQAPLPPATQGS